MPERGEPQNKVARTLGQGDDLRCIQILISQKTCEPVVALLTHCCVDTKQKIVCNCKDASGPCVTLALQILVPGFPITRGPGVNRAAKSNCLQRGREETSLETRLWKHERCWDITTRLAACTGFASGTGASGTPDILYSSWARCSSQAEQQSRATQADASKQSPAQVKRGGGT